ncbi:MAG: helix-turn-helix domain-containing protein [Vicinamibacterales bacterium]
MTSQEVFITRLRRQRERSRVTLESIGQATRVRLDMLEALERGDLHAWPKGLYARAWVRGYAEAVGLEPDDIVEEFCRLFPHADRRSADTMNDLAAILDLPANFVSDGADGLLHGRRGGDRPVPISALSWRDRLARAVQIVADVRRARELPARLLESWRTLRPSRRAS